MAFCGKAGSLERGGPRPVHGPHQRRRPRGATWWCRAPSRFSESGNTPRPWSVIGHGSFARQVLRAVCRQWHLAESQIETGNLEEARRTLGRAVALATEVPVKRQNGSLLAQIADLQRKAGARAEAMGTLGKARTALAKESRRETRLWGKTKVAKTLACLGKHPMPFRFWTTSVTTCSSRQSAGSCRVTGTWRSGMPSRAGSIFALAGSNHERADGDSSPTARTPAVCWPCRRSRLSTLRRVIRPRAVVPSSTRSSPVRRRCTSAPRLPRNAWKRGDRKSAEATLARTEEVPAKGLTGAEIDGSCWEVLAGSYAWFGEVAKVRHYADAREAAHRRDGCTSMSAVLGAGREGGRGPSMDPRGILSLCPVLPLVGYCGGTAHRAREARAGRSGAR